MYSTSETTRKNFILFSKLKYSHTPAPIAQFFNSRFTARSVSYRAPSKERIQKYSHFISTREFQKCSALAAGWQRKKGLSPARDNTATNFIGFSRHNGIFFHTSSAASLAQFFNSPRLRAHVSSPSLSRSLIRAPLLFISLRFIHIHLFVRSLPYLPLSLLLASLAQQRLRTIVGAG